MALAPCPAYYLRRVCREAVYGTLDYGYAWALSGRSEAQTDEHRKMRANWLTEWTIYFSGRTNGDAQDFMIDALQTDGTVYTPFAVYGHFELDNAMTDLILDLVIDEEGRLLASGTSGIPGFFGDRDFALLRLLPDGTPDLLFGMNTRAMSAPLAPRVVDTSRTASSMDG